MKILHFVTTSTTKLYPLGTPGRFTDLIQTLNDHDHENTVLLPDLPVLQAALERKEISFTLTNVSFIENLFRENFYKKILKRASPDIILRYNDIEPEDMTMLKALYKGPVLDILDFYTPILNPDSSIKKMEREETVTPEGDIIIGCFAPQKASISNLDTFLNVISESQNITLWFAIDPALSSNVQDLTAKYNLDKKIRFFDVTVPRGAFYKGCDIIFIQKGGVDSDMALVEASSLGCPFISSNPNHKKMLSDDHPFLIEHDDKKAILSAIADLASHDSKRIQTGEKGRQIYEKSLSPVHGLEKFMHALKARLN